MPRGAADCVGRRHADADALVKCGADCLTPPPDGAPPTLFVRGPRRPWDVAGAARHIEELLIEEGPVLLLVAPEHADFGEALAAELETRVGPCTASSLPAHVYDEAGPSSPFVVAGLGTDAWTRRTFAEDASPSSAASARSATPWRCGRSVRLLRGCRPKWRRRGRGRAGVAGRRALARRRHARGRARQASRWGVVAGAGRIAGRARAARACDALIRETGRASYVIAVGPITPAKLANFAELEALCIVGADVETLEDAWKGGGRAARGGVGARRVPRSIEVAARGRAVLLVRFGGLGDSPKIMTVTTRRTSTSRPGNVSGRAWTSRTNPTRRAAISSSGSNFAVPRRQRPSICMEGTGWQGLEVRRGETEVHVAAAGRTGVASGYAEEPDVDTTPLVCVTIHSAQRLHRR